MKRSVITFCMLLASLLPGLAVEEKPHGSMQTRWAAQVDPNAPLPEYPRPSLVRRGWANLNGRWDYAITPRDDGRPGAWDGTIVVPFCAESQLSGVQRFVGADKRLWYRRDFEVLAREKGERTILNFGAVDWEATVWVNGKKAGTHRGGYDPFSFDITDALKVGNNELIVAVWDPTDDGAQPRGKQIKNPHGIWYTAVTGIWQTVWLETVPAMHLTAVRAQGDPQSGELTVFLASAGAGPGAAVKTTIEVSDGDTLVATGTIDSVVSSLRLRIPNPKPWTPDAPHLYGLRVKFGDDYVESYCALRTVSWKADEAGLNRLFLNGKPVFHYGPLDQGWWPDGLYTAPTDDALRYDIEMTRAMGFNMARKHVKVEPARWYYWADKLGLMVWQDMPSGFATGRRKGEPNADHGNFKRELAAVMEAFRFHPSIVAWIPYNEGWGQPSAEPCNAVLQWTKKRDPSRFVGAASGWTDHGWGDWKDMHKYPGPGMIPPMEERVSVLGEFGGLGLPVTGHLWWDKRNWGYRTYKTPGELKTHYADLIVKLERLMRRGLAAAVYTQTTDCEGEVNGLMTYDREVKMDAPWLKSLHAPLYLKPKPVKLRTISPTAEKAKEAWRFIEAKPADGWEKPGFDDAGWNEGPGGFGTPGTPGARIGTEWKSGDIWIRKRMVLDALPKGQLLLRIHHDEDAVVFLNGMEVARRTGFVSDYLDIPLGSKKAAALKRGENVLAIHCRQTRGGQFIDAGLLDEVTVGE